MGKLTMFLLLAALAAPALAQCPITDIRAFAEMVAAQHKAGTLEKLDQRYAGRRPFKVIIENSLAEGDAFERKTVTSFAAAAGWINARRVEGFPQPDVRKLLYCRKGVCEFDFFAGINHNTLYLYQITYRGTPTCATLKTIQFLDGD